MLFHAFSSLYPVAARTHCGCVPAFRWFCLHKHTQMHSHRFLLFSLINFFFSLSSSMLFALLSLSIMITFRLCSITSRSHRFIAGSLCECGVGEFTPMVYVNVPISKILEPLSRPFENVKPFILIVQLNERAECVCTRECGHG